MDYAVMLLLLCVSGNIGFTQRVGSTPIFIVTAIILGILLLSRQGKGQFATLNFKVIFCSFVVVLIIQSITLSFLSPITIAGFLTRLFIGYAAFRLVFDPLKTYINAMLFLCLMSLAFYIPYNLGLAAGIDIKLFFDPLRNLIGEGHRYSIFVNTFNEDFRAYKNSGLFAEPGMFGAYLLLGLTFLAFAKDKFSTRAYTIRLVIFSICLMTTCSTTAYVLFPLALLMHYKVPGRTRESKMFFTLLSIVFFLPMFAIATYGLSTVEFVGDKIIEQYNSVYYEDYGYHTTRLGNIVIDYDFIKERPFWGWGGHSMPRYQKQMYSAKVIDESGGGLTGFVVNYGLVGFVILIIGYWRSLSNITNQNYTKIIISLAVIMGSLIGQPLLNYPLYFGLLFLPSSPIGRKDGDKVKVLLR